MAKRLKVAVYVRDEHDKLVLLTPGEDVPDWAVGKIGAHAFEDAKTEHTSAPSEQSDRSQSHGRRSAKAKAD